MKKNRIHLVAYICVVLGLSASMAFAELGLASMTAADAKAAVEAAIQAAYTAPNATPEQIKQKIAEILAEAAATQNQQFVTDAVTAILTVGFNNGNITLAQTGINEALTQAAATSGSALAGFQSQAQTQLANTVTLLNSTPPGTPGGGTGTGTGSNTGGTGGTEGDGEGSLNDGDNASTPT